MVVNIYYCILRGLSSWLLLRFGLISENVMEVKLIDFQV